jgi:(2R)-ethylmalonyl-CoA mutase
MPRWNPVNICSYHLQEAGATPVQEVASRCAPRSPCSTRCATAVRCPPERFADVVQRISFFVNAGVRFVEEMCKMRAFVPLWDEITVTGTASRTRGRAVPVRRAGDSLGLTEAQPGEQRPADRARDARGHPLHGRAARAVQLPAWNEALGLPRPWDQQWSLRIQQVLRLRVGPARARDLFDGSPVVEELTTEIAARARGEIDRVQAMGGVGRRGGERVPEVGAGRLARGPAAQDRERGGRRGRASTGSPPPSRRR